MKKKVSEISGLIRNFTKINDTISKCSINICYPGENVNGSHISKEVLSKMSSSLLGCALVGEIKNGNFTDHAEVLRRNGGKWDVEYLTQPYGFVNAGEDLANIRWENIIDQDGITKEYLSCDAYLWTARYPELIDIFTNHDIQQSMEIWIKDGEVKNGTFYIYDAEFIGLCMLGTAPPAFEDANVKMYSATHIPDDVLKMIAEFKKSLKKEDVELDIFNHEEFAQKNFSMTANQIRGLLQNAISAKYANKDWEQRYSVEDWDDSSVYTVNWCSEDRIAYSYKIENGEAIVDFENPFKYMNGPQIVSEIPEGYQPSVFESVKSYCEASVAKFNDYDELKINYETSQKELTIAQNELKDMKTKYEKFYKEYFETKAQEKYESDDMAKATIKVDEFNKMLDEFTEKGELDLDVFADQLDLAMAHKLRQDPSILQRNNDGINHMDAFSRRDQGDDNKQNNHIYSPYPGEKSKED